MRGAISRLPANHEQLSMLQSQHASRVAGFFGEKQVDRVFQSYTFEMKNRIFNGLSLKSSTNFQIDSLFLTPSYAVIFETKNIAGSITVKTNPPQLVQTLDDGTSRSYVSPVTQVQNNMELLRDWFHDQTVSIPIYGVIVLAFPKKEVHLIDIDTTFLYPAAIPTYLRQIPMTPPSLDDQAFHKITQKLLDDDSSFIPNPISTTYNIQKEDFLTGVVCPSCRLMGMVKYKGGWLCNKCSSKNKDAHRQAIRDWFLLFGGQMTNKDCREFLQISDRHTAIRVLKSMNLETLGEKRNTEYAIKNFN